MYIPTIQIESPILANSTQAIGARANIHANDEGFLAEQRDTKNAIANFNNGVEQTARFGLELKHQHDIILEKEAQTKRDVDKSTYMNNLRIVSDKFLEDTKLETDPEVVSKAWDETFHEYTNNFKEENQTDPLFDKEVYAQAENYYTTIGIKGVGTARKNNTIQQVSRLETNTKSRIANASITNYDADMAQQVHDTMIKAELIPMSDEMIQAEGNSFSRNYLVSAFGKEIINKPNSPDLMKAYMENDKLTQEDKNRLRTIQKTESINAKNDLYNQLFTEIEEGKTSDADLEKLRKTKDYKGHYLLSPAQYSNVQKWRTARATQTKQLNEAKATSAVEQIKKDVYRLDINDPKYAEKVAFFRNKVFAIPNITEAQMHSYDTMIDYKGRQHEITNSLSVDKKEAYTMSLGMVDSAISNADIIVPSADATDEEGKALEKALNDNDTITLTDLNDKYKVANGATFDAMLDIKRKVTEYAQVAESAADITKFTKELLAPLSKQNYRKQIMYRKRNYYIYDSSTRENIAKTEELRKRAGQKNAEIVSKYEKSDLEAINKYTMKVFGLPYKKTEDGIEYALNKKGIYMPLKSKE